MTNDEILHIALAQSAADCSCAPEDFLRNEHTLTLSAPSTDARRYLELPHSCNFVYYGHGIVATAGEAYMDAAGRCLALFPAGEREYHLFETPGIHQVDGIFASLGAQTRFMAEYFLPDVERLHRRGCPFDTRTLGVDDFRDLYTPEWSHALCAQRSWLDVLGVGAYDGERLVGLAACSADCDTMWQIGIDILPEYRRRGIAAALVSELAIEILDRGKVPFYCAAWSNIRSVRTALSAGFKPAWVELTLKKEVTE